MARNHPSAGSADTESDQSVGAPSHENLLVAGSAVGGLGGALAALLGALCCVGSLSVVILGVGGALAAAQLTPYRAVLLIVSAALLAFGLWSAYGQRMMRGGQSCPVRVGRLTRMFLWIAAFTWLVAAVFPEG